MYVLAQQPNGQLQRQSMYKETTSKHNQDKQSRAKEWNKEKKYYSYFQ